MATKRVSKHIVLEMDPAAGTSFAAVSLMRELTPPNRVRQRVDGLALGDDLNVPLVGVEDESEMTFMQFWDPGDTDHELLDSQFDSEAEASFRITYTNEGAAGYVDTFNGKVFELGPQSNDPTGSIQRQVTIIRTSDITRAVLGP